LDRYVFAADALTFAPEVLDRLGTSEWAGYGFGDVADNRGQLPLWAYDPPLRHDIALGERVAGMQSGVLDQVFLPAVLARIVDGEAESRGDTMHLSDLFDWLHASIYRELGSGAHAIAPQRRALQAAYTERLANLYAHPAQGVPSDARALARAELVSLAAAAAKMAHAHGLDGTTRAHLEMLEARAKAALETGRAA
jgi:hypothetical protein